MIDPTQTELEALIRESIQSLAVAGKCGKSILQPRVAEYLSRNGFDVDIEDRRVFLPACMPVWRDKDSQRVEKTTLRRRIDIVVRQNARVVALIETESDLDDLREYGVSRRRGHYDVYSIARGASGSWFHSYKSLERMAAAVFYASGGTLAGLEQLHSDLIDDHNPQHIALFLVTGRSREADRRILSPRARSLGARIISAVEH